MFDQVLLQQMIDHATTELPKESCGLVIAGKYVPCVNRSDTPKEEFRIDPTDYADALACNQLQAVIHSHPDGPDHPSLTDMQQQVEFGVPWGIVVTDKMWPAKVFFWGEGVPVPPLIGREFRHGVTDCYATVKDWFAIKRGVFLPDLPRGGNWWDEGKNIVEEHYKKFGFVDLSMENNEWKEGDCVIAKVRSPVVNHTGVYVGNGMVLHHMQGRLSREDMLMPWMRFVVKKVRYAP